MYLSLIIMLVFAVFIGYTAQVTGLCMVRGVKDWSRGKRLRLTAILSSGFWIYLYLPVAQMSQIHFHLAGYNFQWRFYLVG